MPFLRSPLSKRLHGASAALLLLCCNDPEVADQPRQEQEEEELDLPLELGAHVSCPGEELLTTLGWASPSGQHQLGEVYLGTLDYVGEEPCLALRFDSLQDAWLSGADQTSEPVTLGVDAGFALEFGDDVPLDVREVALTELIDTAQFRLEGVSAGWLEPKPSGWLDAYLSPGSPGTPAEINYEIDRLRRATFYPFDQFVFIVTRIYSAQRVTTLDGGVDGLGTLRYPGTELETSYDCPLLPLGDAGVDFYDGVFVDMLEDYSSIIARTDLPRQFCPDLAGSQRPPGNGALLPPAQ